MRDVNIGLRFFEINYAVLERHLTGCFAGQVFERQTPAFGSGHYAELRSPRSRVPSASERQARPVEWDEGILAVFCGSDAQFLCFPVALQD